MSQTLAQRFTSDRNAAIRRLIAAGEPDSSILRRYGVSRDTLNQLRGNA